MGDGSDTVEGQDGNDTLRFNGANITETINISANGGRTTVHPRRRQHHHGPNDIENIQFNALGGADKITVNNLAGTASSRSTSTCAGRRAAPATARPTW